MSTQPEALRLADWCDTFNTVQHSQCAAELRRLHAENIELRAKADVAEAGYRAAVRESQWQASTNAELNRHMGQKHELRAQRDALLEALQALYDEQEGPPLIRRHRQWQAAMDKARAAIAKAEEQT